MISIYFLRSFSSLFIINNTKIFSGPRDLPAAVHKSVDRIKSFDCADADRTAKRLILSSQNFFIIEHSVLMALVFYYKGMLEKVSMQS